MQAKPRRSPDIVASDDGSALLIVILLVLGLSVFGLSVVVQSTIEDMLSLHEMSSTQALLSADAAVEMAVPWLNYDHREDPNGWSNEYLLTPAPLGAWPAGLLQDDGLGSVTGVADAFYYDLQDSDSDGTPDQVVPSLTGFDVPSGLAFSGHDASLLPMGEFRVRLRNLSDDTGAAPVVYEEDKIALELNGTSEDLSSYFGREATAPSRAVIEVILDHGSHSIWENAVFSDGPLGSLPNDLKIHGSVHIIGQAGQLALALQGNAQILNNYEGLSATLRAAIPAAAGNPASLEAELRARNGAVEINSGAASIGEADGSAGAGIKDSLDGAYVANEAIEGSNPERSYLDELEGYDMLGFTFLEMMEASAFTDPLTSTDYSSYYAYLSGSADGNGISALDVSFFETHGGSKGNVSLNRTSTLFDPAESFAQQLETRYSMLVDYAFLYSPAGTKLDVYIEQADGSWGEQNHVGAGSAPAATPGTDVTGVIGIVKEVPDAVVGGSNPFPDGYRHGFIWIPPDVAVGAVGAAILDGMITRMNEYMDVPIDSPVDVGTGTILASTEGRIFASGVILMHRLFMNRGVEQNANSEGSASQDDTYLADVRYTGDFALISEHISEIAADLLPMRTFSCQDALGIASTEDVDFDTAGLLAVGAFYAEDDITVAQDVQIAGALIAGDRVVIEGPNVHLAAVPSLPDCLPPFLPDFQIFNLLYQSWTEIR